MDKSELLAIHSEVKIISKKLVAGRPLVHIYSDENPGLGFRMIEPNLEDVFFSNILGVDSFKSHQLV